MSSAKKLALQKRRLRAVELHERGWRSCDIALALHVSKAAVSQWLLAHKNSPHGVMATNQTGAPKKLSALHSTMLIVLLQGKPSEFGLEAETWSRKLAMITIQRLFGVTYTLQHIGRLIVSTQQPSTKQITMIENVEDFTLQRSIHEIKQLIRKNLDARKITN